MGRTKQLACKTFVPAKKAVKKVKLEPSLYSIKNPSQAGKGTSQQERVKRRAKQGVVSTPVPKAQ